MRDRPLRTGQSAGAIILAVTAMAQVQPALAEIDLTGGVAVGSQYDTNARQLANIEEAPLDDKGRRKRDAVSMYATANVAAKLGGTGPLRGQALASYNHSDSMSQDALSHDDYTLGLNLDYRPGQVYDVSVQATQTRAPIGLADVGGTSTVEQTATNAQGTLRVRPTPRWQLSLSPGWSETRTPLADADDFRLTTRTGAASIEFLGASQLVPGLGASQSKSTYSGITNATRYTQQSAFATLNYKVTAVTNFSLTAGKSWRETDLRESSSAPGAGALAGKDSAFTGSLGITRQLTPKTGVNISAFRNFQQYDAGVNTSIGTGFSAAVNWAATARFSASLGTAYTQSVIDNVAFGSSTIERTDLVRSYSLGMNYRATRMVTVNASATRNVRRSEVWVDQYNSTVGAMTVSIVFD
jgi:hypothetical protein